MQETLDPDEETALRRGGGRTAVLACGALAREILDLVALNGLDSLTVTCLPASLHNRPERIPDRLRSKLRSMRGAYDRVLIAYADCGTGGLIDRVIKEEAAPDFDLLRIGGPHCYAFFAGQARFDALADPEPGTFYLTDYLARHFETLVVKGMGLDRYPGMTEMMFGNYTRLLYLAQTDDAGLDRRARAAADRLGLRFERLRTGYGELADFIGQAG